MLILVVQKGLSIFLGRNLLRVSNNYNDYYYILLLLLPINVHRQTAILPLLDVRILKKRHVCVFTSGLKTEGDSLLTEWSLKVIGKSQHSRGG